MENRQPKLVIGAFIMNERNELLLRTTPSQDNRYTCINGQAEWGKTIEETLRDNVKAKTNLNLDSFELIGLTDGLNIVSAGASEPVNMVFADYKVIVKDLSEFRADEGREYAWRYPSAWLELDESKFAPYIREIIEKLV